MTIQFPYPLINAHTHAAMVAFRGLAEDLGLEEWLTRHIWPLERQLTPEKVYQSTRAAIREMRTNGIRLFADMYFFQEQVAQAAIDEAMPVVLGEGLLDFPTPSSPTPEEALATTERLIRTYQNHPLVSVAVAPHAIYTVSRDNLMKAKELAVRYDVPFHIHVAETEKEVQDCINTHDATPIGYLAEAGILDHRTILAHAVWLTDADIALIARAESHVVHCPLSNMKLASGIAPITRLLAAGVNVALGTDGAASSNRLDIWEAGKIAALLAKVASQDPASITARDAVRMMTVNGMRALGITEIEGQTPDHWASRIARHPGFEFLYQLQSRDLNFTA